MYLLGLVGLPPSPMERTLKRARRTAPIAANVKATKRPTVPCWKSDHL